VYAHCRQLIAMSTFSNRSAADLVLALRIDDSGGLRGIGSETRCSASWGGVCARMNRGAGLAGHFREQLGSVDDRGMLELMWTPARRWTRVTMP
jgi:hypothetical protein